MPRLAQLLRRVFPAAVVASVGACFLFDWVVDDAAISYSYARNAALGLGLVSQAGRTPVEGFSSPLWVGLLATVAWVRGMSPSMALKCLSWTFQGACLLVAAFSTMTRGIPVPAASLFVAMLALEPPLLVWSNSGLESPLLFFALLVLAEALAASMRTWDESCVLLAGAAAAVCCLTRPEGVLVALGGLGLLALPNAPAPRRAHAVSLYGAMMGAPVLTYVGFRRFYFGDWLPNTFYAKGGITSPRVLDAVTLSPHAIAKLVEVAEALGGYFGAGAVLVLFVGLVTFAVRRGVLTPWSTAYLVLAITAVVGYVLLPGDWMGEYRYAAPAVLLLSMALFHISADLWSASGKYAASARSLAALVVVAAIATATPWVLRINDFRSQLPMPLSEVIDRARRFERAGRMLRIERPSILTQDVGGFLLRDGLELHDIGMLTDHRIARAIGEWRTESNRRDLHAYVFEEVKPDFISVVAYHAWAARLDEDPRLARDYLPINTRQDAWVLRRYGVVLESGDYVRKARIRHASELSRLRGVLANSRGP